MNFPLILLLQNQFLINYLSYTLASVLFVFFYLSFFPIFLSFFSHFFYFLLSFFLSLFSLFLCFYLSLPLSIFFFLSLYLSLCFTLSLSLSLYFLLYSFHLFLSLFCSPTTLCDYHIDCPYLTDQEKKLSIYSPTKEMGGRKRI